MDSTSRYSTYTYNGASNFTLVGTAFSFNPTSTVSTISDDGTKMYSQKSNVCHQTGSGWTYGPKLADGNKGSFSTDGTYLILNTQFAQSSVSIYKYDGANWNLFQTITPPASDNTRCSYSFVSPTSFIFHYYLSAKNILVWTLQGSSFVQTSTVSLYDAACEIAHSYNG
jgi:hypothetical protein